MFNGLHRFLPTLAKLEGYRIAEVKVAHQERREGKSKFGVWNRLFKGLSDLRTKFLYAGTSGKERVDGGNLPQRPLVQQPDPLRAKARAAQE